MNARDGKIIISGTENLCISEKDRDFPGGPVVQNLPSNIGDAGLIPHQGIKIPHAIGQATSLYTLTTEPVHSRACVLYLENPTHGSTREKIYAL